MTDQIDTPRTIETEIELDAPARAVWRALTEAEELTNWFPLEARVKPGVGGSVWVSWGEGLQWETPIAAWDENRHLRLIYAEPTPPAAGTGDEEPPLFVPFQVAVDYHLEARRGRTVLRVVHSGFSSDPGWDNQYDGTVRGWQFELRGLKHYLERHRGTRRVVVHAKHALGDLPLEDAWRRLLSPDGLAAEGQIDTVGVGDRYRLQSAAGDVLEGLVHIIDPPRDLCATVENVNDGLLRLKLDEPCLSLPAREVNFWLSTFGLPPDRTDGLQKRAQEVLDRVFGGAGEAGER